MIDAHHAYLLGFTPQILGVFWNGLAVLEVVQPAAQGALRARIDSMLELWVGVRGPDVVKQVHLVEALLRSAGRQPGEPPQSVRGYHQWAEDVRQQTYEVAREAFEAETDLHVKMELFRVRLAHDLGEQIGDLIHLYVLASLVKRLLGDEPGHAMLAAHAASLAEAQNMAMERLARVRTYAAGFDDIVRESERVLEALRAGPRIDESNHAETAGALGDIVKTLELERVEELFRSRPSSPG